MASLDFEKERAGFNEYYDTSYDLLKAAEDSFCKLVSLLLSDNPLFVVQDVISRLKNNEECITKFILKYQSDLERERKEYEIKDYITDLIGVRVICLYETDISHIKDILEENFSLIEATDKTSKLESQDDRFGYKGLHLDLRLDDGRAKLPEYKKFQGLKFEVQIRTIVQDAWSVLDHKIKYKKSIPINLKRRINRLAAIFELADQEFIHIKNETEQSETAITGHSQNIEAGLDDLPLNAFTFLSVAKEFFPNYNFTPYKVDGFVEDILLAYSRLTPKQLREVLSNNFSLINEYREYQALNHYRNLNPYTMMRHMLYQSDKDAFKILLFDRQREGVEAWLQQKKIAVGEHEQV